MLTAVLHSDLPLFLFCFYCHRIQKELADITLDPPPNCRLVLISSLGKAGEEEELNHACVSCSCPQRS